MKHLFRFFSSALSRESREIFLTDDEHHHLAQVLRLSSGDSVEVFNGKGGVAQASIIGVEKKRTVLTLQNFENIPRPSSPLWIALGVLPKGVLREIVHPLVELGIDRLILFRHHSVAKARLSDFQKAKNSDTPLDDIWTRLFIASCKQCKRAWLPELEVYDSFESFCSTVLPLCRYRFEFAPEASRVEFDFSAPGVILGILGSEMGLSLEEKQKLKSLDVLPVKLGPHILQARTAAVSGAAVLSFFNQAHSSAKHVLK